MANNKRTDTMRWRDSGNNNNNICADYNGYTATVFEYYDEYRAVIKSDSHMPVYSGRTYRSQEEAQKAVEDTLRDPAFDLDDFAQAQQSHRWRISKNGNPYCFIDNKVCTVFSNNGSYQFVLDGRYYGDYTTLENAQHAVESCIKTGEFDGDSEADGAD
jgi:uncharacterized protein YegP (UPF0339 family)